MLASATSVEDLRRFDFAPSRLQKTALSWFSQFSWCCTSLWIRPCVVFLPVTKKNLYTEFFSDFSRFWKRKVSLSYNFMDLWNFIVISRVQRISNIFLYCLFFMSSYMYVIRIRYVGYKLIRKFLRFYAIKKSKCYKGIALQKLYYCYAIFQVLNYK